VSYVNEVKDSSKQYIIYYKSLPEKNDDLSFIAHGLEWLRDYVYLSKVASLIEQLDLDL